MRSENAVKQTRNGNQIVHAYESDNEWHVITMDFDDEWNVTGETVESRLTRGLAISAVARKTGQSIDLKTVSEIREAGRGNNAKR